MKKDSLYTFCIIFSVFSLILESENWFSELFGLDRKEKRFSVLLVWNGKGNDSLCFWFDTGIRNGSLCFWISM
ncbi:hypothetical protein C1645_835743 [Glomus cerebriforme]|uniref:Uncharacterized protein n=1 Tax=Glomus cerebriforme TaxID=658196 RepID=A0A397SBV8_9GLOM|nr:hypothetical protein C1645_835743 [Glomus cerebriforme]